MSPDDPNSLGAFNPPRFLFVDHYDAFANEEADAIQPDQHTLDLLQKRIMQRIATEPAHLDPHGDVTIRYEPYQPETFGQLLHRQEFTMGITRWDRHDLAGSGIQLD